MSKKIIEIPLKGAENIKAGMRIKVKSIKHGDEIFTVKSTPYINRRTASLFMKIRKEGYDFDTETSLRDEGILENHYNDRKAYLLKEVAVLVDCPLFILIRECQDCGEQIKMDKKEREIDEKFERIKIELETPPRLIDKQIEKIISYYVDENTVIEMKQLINVLSSTYDFPERLIRNAIKDGLLVVEDMKEEYIYLVLSYWGKIVRRINEKMK